MSVADHLRVCIIADRLRVSAFAEGTPFAGWEAQFIEDKLRRAGFLPSEATYVTLSKTTSPPTQSDIESAIGEINATGATVLVPLDEIPLELTTGLRSIRKWHLSPLDSLARFTARKVIPTFHPEQVRKEWDLGFYVERAFSRARRESDTPQFTRKPKRFHLNPPIKETLELLERLKSEPILSIDIETGAGQINTFGVAWSPSDAIAVKVLPEGFGPDNYYRLWGLIRDLCEGPARKVFQNAIYEVMYLSRYGVGVANIWHDTMTAQKFLYPEFDKGLDNVGRLYTNEPYWKDTGKVFSEEGGKRDWSNVKDWPKHFEYNALDTTGTLEAALNQQVDLETRGQTKLFYDYVMRFYEPLNEMCLRGLPVNMATRQVLVADHEGRIATHKTQLSADINPRSAKQKISLLEAKGYAIPKIRNAETGFFEKSANELSLKKLRLKHPEDKDLSALLAIAKLEKALSSYLDCPISDDAHVRFMLNPCGTETGRWSCSKDHLRQGFNAQTIPKYAKKMIEWIPDSGRVFVQCDLKQAESRFVAYDSCDWDLIKMLEDPNEDIHSYVAAEIFRVPYAQVRAEHKAGDSSKRQLGKKSGHGANYAMQETTFMESCLKEMDVVLTKTEAKNVLEAYHKLFPGIRRWHKRIRDTIYRERRLTNPMGRVRWFYGRMDDATFREGYAYLPQSTVPDVTNHLMLALLDARTRGELKFWFHNQVHDSILVSATLDQVRPIAEFMFDTKLWHPKITLAAGQLVIPTSVEWGANLGGLKDYE